MAFLLHKRFSIVGLMLATIAAMGVCALLDGQSQSGIILLTIGLVGGAIGEFCQSK